MGNWVFAALTHAPFILSTQEISYIAESLIAIIDDGFRPVNIGPCDFI